MKIYELKQTMVEGVPVKQLRCVVCGRWGSITDDQYHGRKLAICPNCGHEEQKNYAERF